MNLNDLENELGRLAMKFRHKHGADEAYKRAVADEYAKVVAELIDSGVWNETPPPEDQLPDKYMPEAFNEYWRKMAENDHLSH